MKVDLCKLKKICDWVVIVLLTVGAIFNIWNTYEREQINLQYKKVVDRFEMVVTEYEQIADRMKNELEQVQ